MFGKWRKDRAPAPAILNDEEGKRKPLINKKILLAFIGGAGLAVLIGMAKDKPDTQATTEPEHPATATPETVAVHDNDRNTFPGNIAVLKSDAYLATADGELRRGTMIVEGSCVEISSGTGMETNIQGARHLVTAWQKNGGGNNRAGFIESSQIRPALEGEYTPQNCYAVFAPNALN